MGPRPCGASILSGTWNLKTPIMRIFPTGEGSVTIMNLEFSQVALGRALRADEHGACGIGLPQTRFCLDHGAVLRNFVSGCAYRCEMCAQDCKEVGVLLRQLARPGDCRREFVPHDFGLVAHAFRLRQPLRSHVHGNLQLSLKNSHWTP